MNSPINCKTVKDKAKWNEMVAQSPYSYHSHTTQYQDLLGLQYEPQQLQWMNLQIDVYDETYLLPLEVRNGVATSHWKYYAGIIPVAGSEFLPVAIEVAIHGLQSISIKGLVLSTLKTDPLTATVENHIQHLHGEVGQDPNWREASILNVDRMWAEIWEKVYDSKTRNMCRKASKSDVECRQIDILDHVPDAVACTKSKPVRHGSKLPDYYYDESLYREKMQKIKTVLGDQMVSFGAFHEDTMIAYVNTIRSPHEAIISNLLSNADHYDKAPNNALFAHLTAFYCADPDIKQIMYSFHGTEGVDTFKNSVGFVPVAVDRHKLDLNAIPEPAGKYKDWLVAMQAQGANFVTSSEVLDGKLATDKPNVAIRHDVDYSPEKALRMMKLEREMDIKSTYYIFPKEGYETAFPDAAFNQFEKCGGEVGYHAAAETVDQAIGHVEELRKRFDIKATVPHGGHKEVCSSALKDHVRVFADVEFTGRNDGYIADNRGHIRKLAGVREHTPLWAYVDLDKFIAEMQPGNLYNFLFHPCWYDQNLKFSPETAGILPKKETISACIIAKDEEKLLPLCLESIKDVVDEIIVVDTGSSDQTVEIAERYGAKVSYREWDNDFSAARNYSIQQATQNWILIVDCDDILEKEDVSKIQTALSNPNINAVVVPVLSDTPIGLSTVFQPRFFRRGCVEYRRRVHNQAGVVGKTGSASIRIHHSGYNLNAEEMAKKYDRTEKLLLAELKDKPDDIFSAQNLLRTYRCQQRWDDCIDLATTVVETRAEDLKKASSQSQMILCDLGFAHMKKNAQTATPAGSPDAEKARVYFHRLLADNPQNLDGLFYLAEVELFSGNPQAAIEIYRKYLSLLAQEQYIAKPNHLIVDTYGQQHQAWNNIGSAFMRLGQMEKSRDAFQQAVSLRGDVPLYHENLKKIRKALQATQKKSTDKLDILFVQAVPCIRNYKMAVALTALGHSVSLAWLKARPSDVYKGIDESVYAEIYEAKDPRVLWELGKLFDIIHCHNEPDFPTLLALPSETPVIHDTHDLISLRDTVLVQNVRHRNPQIAFHESLANKLPPGLIYTTPYQRDAANRMYQIDLDKSIVIYNFVSERDVPKEHKPKRSANDNEFHIVYQGGIGVAHRDFKQLFAGLAESKTHIHIYPTAEVKEYIDLAADHEYMHINKPVSPQSIMSEMTQYNAGLIPFNITDDNREFLDTCIGNKLYEYMAAGLPVIACDTRPYRDLFAKNEFGIVYQTVEDILSGIERLKGLDVSDHVFTMEGQMGKLVKFYRETLERFQGRPVSDTAHKEMLAAEERHPDRVAQVYRGEIEWDEATREAIKNRVDRIVEEAIGNVLDVGCSDGITSLLIGKKGLKVIGLDMSPDHISRAQAALNAETNGLSRRVTFQKGWAEDLPFPNNSIDTLILGEILEHVADPADVLEEASRVMIAGGKLLCSVPKGYQPSPNHRRGYDEASFTEELQPYFDDIQLLEFGPQMLAIGKGK